MQLRVVVSGFCERSLPALPCRPDALLQRLRGGIRLLLRAEAGIARGHFPPGERESRGMEGVVAVVNQEKPLLFLMFGGQTTFLKVH